jgi:hypothetical protein
MQRSHSAPATYPVSNEDSKFGWATANIWHILLWFSSITFMGKLSHPGMSHITLFRLALLVASTGASANECLSETTLGVKLHFWFLQCRHKHDKVERTSPSERTPFCHVLAAVSMNENICRVWLCQEKAVFFEWAHFYVVIQLVAGVCTYRHRYHLLDHPVSHGMAHPVTCLQLKCKVVLDGLPFLKDVLL